MSETLKYNIHSGAVGVFPVCAFLSFQWRKGLQKMRTAPSRTVSSHKGTVVMALSNDSCNVKAGSGHGHPSAQATACFSADSTPCDKMKYNGFGNFFICPAITLSSTEGFFWNLRQSLEHQ